MAKQGIICPADDAALAHAARILAQGAVIAFPTDTVYGLCCDLFDREAVGRIYDIKGRLAHLPLIAMVAGYDEWPEVAASLPEYVRDLMDRWWPGPLTIILPARADIPPEVLGGGHTIGLRIPDHPAALRLLQLSDRPLATTSANLSGRPAAVTAADVAMQLGDLVELILDAGPAPGGLASTVLDCTVTPPMILREGPISVAMLGIETASRG